MANDELLKVKRNLKRKQPTFVRQEHGKSRLKQKYRAPRGIQSKQRLNRRGREALLKSGYQTPAAVRGMDANGLELVRVVRVEELAGLDPKKHSVIVAKVGGKRRVEIISAAAKANLTLHNASEDVAKRLTERKESAHKERARKLAEREQRNKKLEEKLAAEEKKAKTDEKKVEAPSKAAAEASGLEKAAEKAERQAGKVEKKVDKDKEHVAKIEKKVAADEKKAAAKTAKGAENE